MGKNATGWIIFIAALGMMCGLLSDDISHLKSWHDVAAPSFVALLMAHFAAVVTAFLGGLQIQPDRTNMMTRLSDLKEKEDK